MKKYKIYFFILIGLIAYTSVNYIIYLSEKDAAGSNINSFSDTFWYSIITLTTIGYGDKFPITTIGRLFSLIYILASVGVVGYIISQISNKISKMIEDKKLGLSGTKFEQHIVIINYNNFARQIINEIVNADKKVAVVTNNKEDIDLIYKNFSKKNVFILYHDFVDSEAFNKVNISNSISVLINFEDDTENLVNLINLKSKFSELNYVISLNNSTLKETFNSLGVTFTLSKNEVASKLIASYVFEPEVAKFTEGLMSSAIHDDDLGLMQYKVVKENYYLNKSYKETFLDLKNDFNMILIGISKYTDGQYNLIKNPIEEVNIELNDYLIVMGNPQSQINIFDKFKVEEGI